MSNMLPKIPCEHAVLCIPRVFNRGGRKRVGLLRAGFGRLGQADREVASMRRQLHDLQCRLERAVLDAGYIKDNGGY